MTEQNRQTHAHPDRTAELKKELLSWIQIIVCAAVIAFLLNSFIIANSRVPSASMENTIMTGDRVIGSRLSYKFFGDPKRGDIIIFRWPDNEKILFVKRIIGLPGDTVEIRDGAVYLNGSETALEEPYLREPMIAEPDMSFTVPENAYFCMGDNRNESMDARYWKNTFVYRDKILAKVLFRYWPGIRAIH
ncbi:signal peptidase I [Moryella indoligenes]|uniref:Signal peptidase I n=1 Tax=Moryella indoligenes TaxID=371674 RepID=A0AAE4ALI2_9FIRM|nr:signal peptidase I [Moryella indoligenes]MDQ0153264.1 signal peptidase I [Moryella indoligenes]